MFQKDRVAIVTGAGSGIGKSVALALAAEGVKVAVFDIVKPSIDQTVEELTAAGKEAIGLEVDVSKKETVTSAVDQVYAKWGRIDILVHCAGILYDRTIKKLEEKDWDRVLNINAKGTFLIDQAVTAKMTERNYGRIVNFTSAAFLGNFGQVAYCASKAAVVSITRVAALEYASHGITVNAVAPGVVETPMTKKMPPEAFAALAEKIPVKRVAQPADIVHAVKLLVDDNAAYITGQVLFVDGGMCIGANPA